MENFDFVSLSGSFGLIATALLTVNLLLGVLLSTKFRRTSAWQRLPRFIRAISLYHFHNYTAYIALLTAFIHPVLLLFDNKAGFNLLNIAVPLTAPHQNYIYSLGALAFYGLLIGVITSTVFVRQLFSNRIWKLIHYISYGAATLFFIHGIWADPLLQDRPVNFLDAEKLLSEAGLVLLIIGVIYRLRYAKRKRETETFYPLKVIKIIEETESALSFVLEVPEYFKKQFRYRPGQFITVRVQEKASDAATDSFIKRSYSMTSAPGETDSHFSITIKRLGPISNLLLDTVREGDTLMILPPEGSFFPKPRKQPTHYLFFAAGSGITPFMSMIKSLLKTRTESRISLVYANINEKSIIFKDELERLSAENPEKLLVIHVLKSPENAWTGRSGMLVAETLNELLDELTKYPPESKEYYICGPVRFINLVESVLLAGNISPGNIHAERFTFSPNITIPVAEEKQEKLWEIGDEENSKTHTQQKLAIQLKGEVREIDYSQNETILDAVLRAGLLPPFACQEGVCASCKAKVVSGRVRMLKHEALTPLEADQRNFLTCTAVAVSGETLISFDES